MVKDIIGNEEIQLADKENKPLDTKQNNSILTIYIEQKNRLPKDRKY